MLKKTENIRFGLSTSRDYSPAVIVVKPVFYQFTLASTILIEVALALCSFNKVKTGGQESYIAVFLKVTKVSTKTKCEICSEKVIQANDYSNLCTHVRTHYEDEVEQHKVTSDKSERDAFKSLIYFCRSYSVHGLME